MLDKKFQQVLNHEEVYVVPYYEVNQLLYRHYDLDKNYFDFISNMEANNDSVYRLVVDGKKLSGYFKKEFDKLIKSKGRKANYGDVEHLMNDLATKDIIEKAIYLVEVCY